MKTYTIAVQDGLEPIKALLMEKGHTVVPYLEAGLAADIAVVTGIDSAYEEIDDAQCLIRDSSGGEILLINAAAMTPEQVLYHVEHNRCL